MLVKILKDENKILNRPCDRYWQLNPFDLIHIKCFAELAKYYNEGLVENQVSKDVQLEHLTNPEPRQ